MAMVAGQPQALISAAPPGWHGPAPLTGLVCGWLKAQNLSAASLRCCPSSALVQDFRVLSTHPSLFLFPPSPWKQVSVSGSPGRIAGLFPGGGAQTG